MRPFRFGQVFNHLKSRTALAAAAQRAEDVGYGVFLVPDHMQLAVAPVPMLLAAANATSTLRVGSYVFANDFRHPAVLAKEAAALDILTDGRFEIGLGAGWMADDYRRTGIRFDPPAARLQRLKEAVRVLKALFGGGSVDIDGDHYTLSAFEGTPKPLQQPLPLMIGAGGRRMLEFAAAEADIIAVVAQARHGDLDRRTFGYDLTRERIDIVRAAAGERFGRLEFNAVVFGVHETEDRAAAAAELSSRYDLEPDALLNSPHFMIGTREEMKQQLLWQRAELGLSYVSFGVEARRVTDPLVSELAGS